MPFNREETIAIFVEVEPGLEFQTTPMTQKQWREIMGTDPSHFKGDDLPVESISWIDAVACMEKLNASQSEYTYRLPTEEEWECAARPCDKQNVLDAAWVWENSKSKTHPVGQKLPNDLGLYDMLGNVWEWTSTIEGSIRVLRGGSWGSYARHARSALRNYDSPESRSFNVGLRPARTKRLALLPLDPLRSKSEQALAIARKALKEIEEVLG